MGVRWIWFVTMKLQPGSNRDKWEQKTESLLSLFAFSAYRWVEKVLGSGTLKIYAQFIFALTGKSY